MAISTRFLLKAAVVYQHYLNKEGISGCSIYSSFPNKKERYLPLTRTIPYLQKESNNKTSRSEISNNLTIQSLPTALNNTADGSGLSVSYHLIQTICKHRGLSIEKRHLLNCIEMGLSQCRTMKMQISALVSRKDLFLESPRTLYRWGAENGGFRPR